MIKPGVWFDSCSSSDEFCFIHKSELVSSEKYTVSYFLYCLNDVKFIFQNVNNEPMGHCCPKPFSSDKIDSTCPLGTRLTKYSCNDIEKLPDGTENTKWNPHACQSQTGSYCIKWATQNTNFKYGYARQTVKYVFSAVNFFKIFRNHNIAENLNWIVVICLVIIRLRITMLMGVATCNHRCNL